MSRVNQLSSAVALVMACMKVAAAQDHSAHQHHSTSQPPAQPEHANHADHSQHKAPAPAAPTESELRHVPPPPPERPMHDMSTQEMIELMHMDDAAPFGRVTFDELEWRDSDDADAFAWDMQAWYGGDYNKLWLKTEGERSEGDHEGGVEVLWDRIVSRWWSVQAGARHDYGEGPSRSWAAFGVQGLAPYWFEVEATVYVGEEGRTAARLAAEYEVLLTQRWILQPEIELNLYGKDDPRNGIGAGLSDTQLGVRLRYELRREFAPYVGAVWTRYYGKTADLAHDDGLQLVAGLRVWF